MESTLIPPSPTVASEPPSSLAPLLEPLLLDPPLLLDDPLLEPLLLEPLPLLEVLLVPELDPPLDPPELPPLELPPLELLPPVVSGPDCVQFAPTKATAVAKNRMGRFIRPSPTAKSCVGVGL